MWNAHFHGWVGENRSFSFHEQIKKSFPQQIATTLIHNTIPIILFLFHLNLQALLEKKNLVLLQTVRSSLLIYLPMRLASIVSNLQQLYSRIPDTIDKIFSLRFNTASYVFLLTAANIQLSYTAKIYCDSLNFKLRHYCLPQVKYFWSSCLKENQHKRKQTNKKPWDS